MWNSDSKLDPTDQALLARLMRDGRATWADLAVDLELTAPAIAQRVKRLQERGVIRHFAAIVDASVLAPVSAYVAVRLVRAESRDELHRRVLDLEAIQECSRLAGEDDYVLKIRCDSLSSLDDFVTSVVAALPGVERTRTSVVLASVKETPIIPVLPS